MVASGKSCDGPEPKCGSKMLCGGLFAVALLLGIILFIVNIATTTCLCGTTAVGNTPKNNQGGPACTGNNDSTCCIWGDESGLHERRHQAPPVDRWLRLHLCRLGLPLWSVRVLLLCPRGWCRGCCRPRRCCPRRCPCRRPRRCCPRPVSVRRSRWHPSTPRSLLSKYGECQEESGAR